MNYCIYKKIILQQGFLMNTNEAIYQRRSIRKFINKEIPEDIMRKILNAGIESPSAKNRQPWKYIVITNRSKKAMLTIMEKGIQEEQNANKETKRKTVSSAVNTLQAMREAAITVFVVNTDNRFTLETDIEEKFYEIANIQSIGASIENMLLEATELGIGSLWICDIFSAYEGLCKWLNIDKQLIAAISFGYADEVPIKRPRKDIEEVTEWR
jgi:nitroreductase